MHCPQPRRVSVVNRTIRVLIGWDKANHSDSLQLSPRLNDCMHFLCGDAPLVHTLNCMHSETILSNTTSDPFGPTVDRTMKLLLTEGKHRPNAQSKRLEALFNRQSPAVRKMSARRVQVFTTLTTHALSENSGEQPFNSSRFSLLKD